MAKKPTEKDRSVSVKKIEDPNLVIELRLAQVRKDVAIYRPDEKAPMAAFSVAELMVNRDRLPRDLDYDKKLKVRIEM